MDAQKKKVGNYLLVSNLGKGQFGVVYKGVAIDDQTQVYAIKCINKAKMEGNAILNRLFQTEMNVMSKIVHPNVMHLYEFMETASNYYLVIQYCNNGDLESYLKKTGRLCEEEAVYFLMQIANGFQVLHKNKIMHRDVKLANLFLQDDQVVIGDFGFAKQGVDVTRTKLGTPITMAPELLTSTGGGYNNKADLWSIGVVFYQMLFGRTPFDAKSYDELKEKVRLNSGSNLRFPADVQISPVCKSLLVSLMQYDVRKRIEWRDFFNHPLFELHAKQKQASLGELGASTLYRNHEAKVKQEFSKNKQGMVEAKLVGLEALEAEHGVKTRNAKEETIAEHAPQINELMRLEKFEESMKYIRARYCHEKKTIIHVMYTVRKLRNLAKLAHVFNHLTDRFMFAACLLLRKGLLLNETAIASVKTGDNAYALQDFARFLQTDERTKVQLNFEDDQKIYVTFAAQMNAKFNAEVASPEIRQEMARLKSVTADRVGVLDEEMAKHFRFFKDSLNLSNLPKEHETDYYVAIVHFYYAVYCDKKFPFITKNKIFEWKRFESETKPENAKKIFKSLQ